MSRASWRVQTLGSSRIKSTFRLVSSDPEHKHTPDTAYTRKQMPGRESLKSLSTRVTYFWVGSEQKKMLICLYTAKKKRNPEMKYEAVIKELVMETGIGRNIIVRTIATYKKERKVNSSNKKKKRTTIFVPTDETMKMAISREIHDFWFRKEIPILKKILVDINNDPELPNYTRTTLYRIL
ncbi:uncharacterized protein LOC143187652 [Calliopsis andreniformis]|uniref:uncharacterized protein LOC143187652 n=1 Tax=Calliopsis andreniformis TaxID=337506 RepID=UPI003FCEBAB0